MLTILTLEFLSRISQGKHQKYDSAQLVELKTFPFT